MAAGIPISIGVDWNISGSDNIFDGLRVASRLNDDQFNHAITASEWANTVTINPARALAPDDYVGSLAVGKKADITILRSPDPDPNLSLLQSHVQDVEMVWVNGSLLYGEDRTVDQLRPSECEPLLVRGAAMRACIRYSAASSGPRDKYAETRADITKRLSDAFPGLAALVP